MDGWHDAVASKRSKVTKMKARKKIPVVYWGDYALGYEQGIKDRGAAQLEAIAFYKIDEPPPAT